jgi:hypothetical protein
MDRKRLAVRFSSTLATIGLYLPILAGIITPMLWLLPAWYTAWNVVGFIFPFSDIWGGLWLPFSGDSPLLSVLLLPIWLIEVALFLGGLGISVWGLRELAVKHVEGCGLVTTGPYRWTQPYTLHVMDQTRRHTLVVVDFFLASHCGRLGGNPPESGVWTGIRSLHITYGLHSPWSETPTQTYG